MATWNDLEEHRQKMIALHRRKEELLFDIVKVVALYSLWPELKEQNVTGTTVGHYWALDIGSHFAKPQATLFVRFRVDGEKVEERAFDWTTVPDVLWPDELKQHVERRARMRLPKRPPA